MSRTRLEDFAGLLGRQNRIAVQQSRGVRQSDLDGTDRFPGVRRFRALSGSGAFPIFEPSIAIIVVDMKLPRRSCQTHLSSEEPRTREPGRAGEWGGQP